MNVDIQSLGFPITAALSGHAHRRLRFVLTRHGHRIQHVAVRLGDDNGPRGGIDKFCRIQVYLLDAPAAAIEEVGADMHAVIDRAVERVARAVGKNLERARIGARDFRHHDNVTPIDRFDSGRRTIHTERTDGAFTAAKPTASWQP